MDKETIKQVLDKLKEHCQNSQPNCLACKMCKDGLCLIIDNAIVFWDTDKIAEVLSDETD